MYRIKALTLLESLLVLFLCSSVLFLFSGSVKQSVRIAHAEIFILQFERLYKDTQRMAGLKGQQQTLSASNGTLYSQEEVLKVPEEVEINDFSITFDQKSGNSSLQKLQYFFLIRKKPSLINWKLEAGNIRKKSLEAYLLLESLIAMSLLVFFVTVILEQVIQVKKQTEMENRDIEALNVAHMAIDTGKKHLKLNGVEISLEETTSQMTIRESGKVLIVLEKN
ncbi:competence type IV pilus minor pilin ComGD [Lactococcus petauri]|uniref:competence type IV pilus minor pilin ComGD n=2 Tax=Lactococcus petauri TaxID=1940789 RepID=UPI0024341B4B|nr:competence type IV pilus minor pilin ComGD [Lactococcus petauri]